VGWLKQQRLAIFSLSNKLVIQQAEIELTVVSNLQIIGDTILDTGLYVFSITQEREDGKVVKFHGNSRRFSRRKRKEILGM